MRWLSRLGRRSTGWSLAWRPKESVSTPNRASDLMHAQLSGLFGSAHRANFLRFQSGTNLDQQPKAELGLAVLGCRRSFASCTPLDNGTFGATVRYSARLKNKFAMLAWVKSRAAKNLWAMFKQG